MKISERPPKIHAAVSERPIQTERLRQLATDDRAGAVVTFSGVVRNHDLARAVKSIDYHAHPQAGMELEQVLREVCQRHDLYAAICEHRVAGLEVGQMAMFAVVSAAHRREAFAAIEDLVNEVKRRVPIWKKQCFADGTEAWTGIESL